MSSSFRILLVSNSVITFLNKEGGGGMTKYLYNKNIVVIPFDFDSRTTSFSTLLEKIHTQSVSLKKGYVISSIGMMFHNQHKNTLQCFSNDNIKSTEWSLKEDFEGFATFVRTLKTFYEIQDFDIISCDIVSSTFSILSTLDYGGVNVNASTNVVGNSGGWILEQGDVDLIGRYFNAAIVKSKLVLFFSSSFTVKNIIKTFNKEQLLKLTKEQFKLLNSTDISEILQRFNQPDQNEIKKYFAKYAVNSSGGGEIKPK
jgi:hypothetical protein